MKFSLAGKLLEKWRKCLKLIIFVKQKLWWGQGDCTIADGPFMSHEFFGEITFPIHYCDK